VIRATEGDAAIVECLGDHNHCRITRSCALAGILTGAFEQLYAYLDDYSLADLVTHPQALQKQLQIQPLLRATRKTPA
ncbi:MAG TPA: Rrf2 family transcriptional regulator, partial [Rhodocyclaceae bacterium]|nr:Rrf2 family transcriptional regulator [Rhodocyclaceae bacterium]